MTPAADEFSVTPTLADESRATHALTELLVGRPHAVRDRAVLLIAELLSAGRANEALSDELLRVRVISEPRSLRIEVRDRGDGTVLRSLRQLPGSDPSHGWSPHLLSSVADRWGLVSSEDGTWVWFELELLAEEER